MWLHVPGMLPLSAPAQEDLISAFASQPEAGPELFCISSETAMPRPLSWPGWKRRPWKRLLFGTVLRPLEASRGADAFIASLPAFPVSPQASPAAEKGPATKDGFGRTSLESFAQFDRHLSYWKTSQGSLLSMMDGHAERYSEAWPSSVICSQLMCFQLKPWVHPILDDDYSFSANWPTPVNPDSGQNQSVTQGSAVRPSLRQIGELWSTPKATTGGANYDDTRAARGAGGTDLQTDATLWVTPQAADSLGEGREPRLKKGEKIRPDESRDPNAMGSYRQDLKDQATLRATRAARDYKDTAGMSMTGINPDGSERDRGDQLGRQAIMWQTPRATDAHGAGYQRDHGQKGRERLSLTGEGLDWQSPKVSPDLNMTVEMYLSSRPVQDWLTLALSVQSSNFSQPILKELSDSIAQSSATPSVGPKSSKSRPRLNPLFVHWLMAWPIGWAYPLPLAWTHFESWEMASTSFVRRYLSLYWRKG
jgi:hypothetical protein